MDDLTEYLRSTFHEQRRQVEKINRLVGEILPVFLSSWDENSCCWPYQLRDREAPSKENRYSDSTTSMILFSLAAALGQAKETVLLPALRQATPFKEFGSRASEEQIRTLLDKGAKHLMAKLEPKPNSKPLVNSGTYGSDDALTLTWVAELLKSIDETESNAVASRVATTVQETLERFRAKNNPKDFLVKAKLDEDPRLALDHSFLRLRAMQLCKYLREIDMATAATKEIEEDLLSFFEARLHLHLSYYMVPDSRFDPADLAFCLEGTLVLGKHDIGERVIERVFFRPKRIPGSKSLLATCRAVYWHRARHDAFSN